MALIKKADSNGRVKSGTAPPPLIGDEMMADITMCLNGCGKQNLCYRWTAPASDYQSVCDFKPNDDGECEHLYERNQ